MAKRTVIETFSPPELVQSRDKIRDLLNLQLEKGRELQNVAINSEEEYHTAEAGKEKWKDYVEELLQRSFNKDSIRKEFASAYGAMRMAINFYDMLDNYKNDIDAKVSKLESIIDRLELIPEPNVSVKSNIENFQVVPQQNSKEVFIVHGHDHEMKVQVARFIESIGLTPIILHEQPNGGKTLIEKLEYHSGVGFSVVLITPDDIGYENGHEEDARPRARQNVIAELGFFVGKLNRKNVSVLYDAGVELPTDFLGVVYIPIDKDEGWKLKLAKEIKNAGLPIDLNKAL